MIILAPLVRLGPTPHQASFLHRHPSCPDQNDLNQQIQTFVAVVTTAFRQFHIIITNIGEEDLCQLDSTVW